MTMADFSVKIINIPNFLKKWFDVDKAIKESLFDAWNLIRWEASRNAPVKSWTLRRSINYQVTWNKLEVGSNVVYAPIQEFWWRAWRWWAVYIRPKKYITRAIQQNLWRIVKIFETNLSNLFNK